MDENNVGVVEATTTMAPAVEYTVPAQPVKKEQPKKDKPSDAELLKKAKKEIAEYKNEVALSDRARVELAEELEGQRIKNEILFKTNQDMKQQVSELESKQALVMQVMSEKFRMLTNDLVILLNAK